MDPDVVRIVDSTIRDEPVMGEAVPEPRVSGLEETMRAQFLSMMALAFATTALPGVAFADDAADLCAGLEGKKLEKCEAKRVKQLEKLRANTTPFQPSKLHEKFSSLDADDANPFNMDKYYVGVTDTGIGKVDEVVAQVMRVQAAVKMASYVGELNEAGEKDKAAELAIPTIEVLASLKDAVKDIQAAAQEVAATPPTELVENPADALKVPKAVGALTAAAGSLTQLANDLPNALAAVQPLAGAAAQGAVEQAAEAVEGAVEEAVDGAGM